MTQRELFLQYQGQTSDTPLLLEFERAEGIYMFDKKGDKFIDIISGIGVSSVGHGHPKVVEAVKNQAEKYMHLMVYGEFVQTPQVQLAQNLAKTLEGKIKQTYNNNTSDNKENKLQNTPTSFFVNSGSEAVEGALKLAKRFTKRTHIVSAENAYHGSTQGCLSVCGDEDLKNAFRPLLPGISHIRYNEITDLELITTQTAAVILEPIQGEAGVIIPTENYLKAVRKRCDATGTLLIIDEIQTGFGRTGKFWAFEHFGIQADLIVCAKGMGGGMPIAAFIAPNHIMGLLKNDPMLGHITTFGGNAVCAAASLATLKIIQEEKLLEQVAQKEQLFRTLLVHSKIKEVRSKGLILAVAFENYETLKPIIDKAITLGLVSDWFLFCDNAMRLAPPLIITKSQIEDACKIILEAIETA